jgi:hypothetical protein
LKALKPILRILILLTPALVIFLASGCRKDKFLTDSSAKLSFSNDTIIFDTVFTSVGSVTQHFKIYNNNRQKILVSRIYLAGSAGTMYRMNVDGVPGRSFSDIELDAGDSLYIFVEATIDPNNQNTPLLVTDSIIFITNGNQQDVDLVAWGQDAYFHTPPSGSGSPFFTLPCNDVWLNNKPHVIYGFAVVDSTCNLTIQPGTQIYSHPNSGLIVYRSGTLNASGTPTNRIGFQGDRLEHSYDSIPGQWSGIIMLEAGPSFIENCDIKNASVGVRVESISGNIDLLTMNQVRIENMTNFGFWNNKAGEVRMTNILISNCGQYNFICTGGGSIFANHCTFANNWSYNDRKVPVFGATNYFEESPQSYVLVDLILEVNNSIIYGSRDNELAVDIAAGALGDLVFNTCLIKSDQNLSDVNRYKNIIQNVDPQFEDPAIHDHHLKSSSPCINIANVFFRVDYDLENYYRDGQPDLGCFEFH